MTLEQMLMVFASAVAVLVVAIVLMPLWFPGDDDES